MFFKEFKHIDGFIEVEFGNNFFSREVGAFQQSFYFEEPPGINRWLWAGGYGYVG